VIILNGEVFGWVLKNLKLMLLYSLGNIEEKYTGYFDKDKKPLHPE